MQLAFSQPLDHGANASKNKSQEMRSKHPLSRAFKKSKKDQRGSSSSGRLCGKKGKDKDRGGEVDGEKKKKPFDKSKVKYYNCQKLGYFVKNG